MFNRLRRRKSGFRQFPLAAALVLSFGLLGAILAAIGGVFFFGLLSIGRLDSAERSSELGEIATLQRVDKNVGLQQVDVFRHVAATDLGGKKSYEQTIARLMQRNVKGLSDYEPAADTAPEKRLLADVLQARQAYADRTRELLALSRAQRNAEAATFLLASQVPSYDRYQSGVHSLLRFEEADARAMAAFTTERIEQTQIIGDILIGLAIVITLGTSAAVWKIVRRLRQDKKSLQTEVVEHQRAEQSLRESEERYRLLVDHSPDTILVVCANEIVFVNPATLKLLRAAQPAQLLGRNVHEILPPEEHAEVDRRMAEIAAGEQPPAAERRFLRLDGSTAEVESTVISFIYEGKPALQVIARDNTERKIAAEKLKAQEQQFRLLFDDNPTPMWVFDIRTLGILAVNQAAISSYGYSREEFLSLTLKNIRPAEDVEMLVAAVSDERASSSYGGEWRHLKKDGTIITATIYSSPTIFENKAARVTLAIDRTERVEAERKMRESEANLALAQKVAGVGSWEYQFTPEGQIDERKLTWSLEAYRLFGLSPQVPISTEAFFRAVHLDDRALFAACFTAFMEDKAPFKTDFRILRPDGTERVVHAVAEKIFDSHSGKLFKVVGTVLDISERRLAEKKLREADEKYRSIFDNAMEGIFQNTPEGVVIAANPALARMLGFESAEDLIRERKDIEQQSYADPAQRAEFQRLIAEKGFVNNFEYEVKRRDGTTIWVSENVRIVRDDSGRALYYEGSAQDITERKGSEKALLESEEKFQQLADSITDVFWITSPDLQIMHYVSPAYEQIWGRSEASLYANPHQWMESILPIDQKRVVGVFGTLMDDAPQISVEYRIARPDGSIRWVQDRGFQIRDARGEVIRLAGIVTDITERKDASTSLIESKQRLDLARKAANIGIWDWNVVTNELVWDARMYELYGIREEDFSGAYSAWQNGLHPDDRERAEAEIRAAVKSADGFHAEFRVVWPNGSVRNLEAHAVVEHAEDGSTTRMIGVNWDITERKRIEGELQRQQSELRVLFDLMPAMIWFKDAANGILRVNKRVADAAGKTVAEIEGKSSFEIYPEEAARFYADDLKVIHLGVPQLGIVESIRTADGKEAWVQTDKVPVFDRVGKVIGIVVVAQDITQRRKSEETLRLLNSAVLQSNEAILITDAELDLPGPRIVFANPAFTAMTGYEAVEVLGKTPRILQGPRTDKAVLARLRRSLKQGKVFKGAAVNYRKDGTAFDLEWQIAPIRDTNDNVTHFVALQRDITDRRQTEQAQARFAAIMAATTDFVGVADGTGRVLYMNNAGRKMVGFTEEGDITKTTIADYVPKSELHRLMEECIPTAMREGVWSGDMTFVDREGGEIPLSQVIVTHKTPAGEVDFVATTAQDLTERKKAEAELEDANRRLLEASRRAGMAEVATSVLHNVGNVLNSVNVSCSVIVEKVRGSRISGIARTAEVLTAHSRDLATFFANDPIGQKLPDFLGKLALRLTGEQADILGELQLLSQNIEHIKDIVAVQQDHAKNIGGVRETLPIEGLVEEALRMSAGGLIRHRIEVVREYGEAPPFSLEKHKVIQILVNLVRNAKHALTDGGGDDKRLVVRIARNNGNVAVSVSDNGIGIAPEDKIRIFSYGFTTKKNGHGFGLHSGVLAAQEMGGSLVAKSDGRGKGATFTLELPVDGQGKT